MEKRLIELNDARYGEGQYDATVIMPDFNIYTNWKIGSLYGPSGTGKTTILTAKFGIPQYKFLTEGKPIDHISENILITVGLMSIPTWYTDISLLSGGEKERYRIACILTNSKENDTIVLDEFTSLVDRATAKGMAKGISKWCRNNNRRLIVASINNDIFSFLKPDFIWSTRYNKFITYVEEEIKLDFIKGSYDDWKLFERYHYLSSKLFTGSAITLALIDNEPVAFIAVSTQIQHGRRIHRLVVLPEWQGLGIGTKLLEYATEIEHNAGFKVYIKTSHPAIGSYLQLSNKWEPSTYNLKLKQNDSHIWHREVRKIPCWCYRYNGGKNKQLSLPINPTSEANTLISTPINPSSETNTLLSINPVPKTNISSLIINDKWDSLIRKGKIETRKNGYVYIRKNYPTTYFGSFQEAYDAQTLSSIQSGCNPYKIVDDNIIIKIKNPLGPNEFFYAKLSIIFLDLVKNRTWFVRHMATGPHARSKINGNHVYLEDICNIPRKDSHILFANDPTV